MGKTAFLRHFGLSHDETLHIDATIADVRRDLRHGRVSAPAAIAKLRAIGCCEPEIAEMVR